jgi:flagellar protein FliJ
MTSSRQLQILIQLGQRDLDRSVVKLTELSTKRHAETQKLDYLRNVASEYQRNSLLFSNQTFELAALQRQQQFSQRLDAAIEEQLGRCGQLEQQLLSAQHRALAQRRRIMTLQKLIARQSSLERSLLDRAEQKHSDEFAARTYSPMEGLAL